MNSYSNIYGFRSIQQSCPQTAASFYSKIAGVTFDGRQRYIPGLRAGLELEYCRDQYNPYDSNAVGLFDGTGHQIGFLSRGVAESVAPKMDRGIRYRITVSEVTGGGSWSYGVNIRIQQL